jgi:hypothetical protein
MNISLEKLNFKISASHCLMKACAFDLYSKDVVLFQDKEIVKIVLLLTGAVEVLIIASCFPSQKFSCILLNKIHSALLSGRGQRLM